MKQTKDTQFFVSRLVPLPVNQDPLHWPLFKKTQHKQHTYTYKVCYFVLERFCFSYTTNRGDLASGFSPFFFFNFWDIFFLKGVMVK